jgi:hypothetical protein
MSVDYLALLRDEREKNMPMDRTAQTAKSPATDFTQFTQSIGRGEKVHQADFAQFTQSTQCSNINSAPETTRHLENAAEAANDATSFRWRVGVGGRDFEVRTLPEATAAEMLALYPGADIEPLPDDDGEPTAEAKPSLADDRRRCTMCRNLARPDNRGERRCLAAPRGELTGTATARNYHPQTDFPKRCEGYAPMPGDPDQRPGRERWRELIVKVEVAA